jgi:PHP family Zn ribbon phosphoesterase
MGVGNSAGVRLYPELTPAECAALKRDECPDCGCKDQWQEGPHGGMCVNWRCGNCGSRFNHGVGNFVERISRPRPLLPRGGNFVIGDVPEDAS